MRLQHDEYKHFRMATFFSLLLVFVLGVFVAIYGKNRSFLIINGTYSTEADYFFNYVTLLGEWVLWVPIFLYAIFLKRDFFLPVLAALVICTLLTHFGKRVLFEGTPRPLRLLEDAARAVPLLKHNNYVNSFPSGHTSTAFTTALLLSFIVQKKFAVFFFPIIALLVGYSRVYLAQHFVTDVLAGSAIGIVSSYAALLIHSRMQKKKRETQPKASAQDG
ncbi:MAG TPA: phosphatase PAP2 family protein [Flavisolibacter sp.]|nr:phosphatase PAP2 family protein [Flavisolibacter sp.]